MRNIAVKLLMSLGIATIFFSCFLFYQAYTLTNKRVGEVVEQQASMALKFDLAIREYIAKNVRPVMYKLLGPDEFMPETMSTSYVARSIFEDVRNEFPDYIIKFASDNPRNPVNQAGPEELKIIEYLNNNPQLQRWEGAISITGKPYFAKFSAMRMEESCMRCHSNPADAPASLLKRYGSTASFNRPLGQVIGLDTVAIPMAKIYDKLWSESLKTFLVSALGLLFFFLLIVSTTRWLVTNRLTMISRHFVNSAQQSDYLEIKPLEVKGQDEISDLAVSFNTLSGKLKLFYSSLEMQVKERTRELEDTNVRLKQEIEERTRYENSLRQSEARYKALFDNMNNGVAVYKAENDGEDFTFIDFNKAGERIDNITKDELIDKSVLKAFPSVRDIGLFDVFQRVYRTGKSVQHPISMYEDERIIGWRENFVYKLPSGEIVAVYSDETERKQAEETIKASLKEKEILLSEIHHRVKNNMQVIISLLKLQSGKIKDKQYANMFQNSQDRIETMSLVHEQLYQTKDFANIDFGEHVESLVKGLFVSYGIDTRKVKLNIDIKDVSFDIENAIPCGLIINELVSNSLKHAFPQGKEGRINISLRSTNEDEFELTVSDDGIGISEDMDIEQTDTMGLHLIKVLAENQLDGKIDLDRTEGTQFNIKFKRTAYKPRI